MNKMETEEKINDLLGERNFARSMKCWEIARELTCKIKELKNDK